MAFMYILLILFEGMPISMSLFTAALIVLHIGLAKWVNENAKCRELDNRTLWTVFTLLFGVLLAVLYVLLHLKLGKKNRFTKAQRNAVILCGVSVAIFLAAAPVFQYERAKDLLEDEKDSFDKVCYLNEDGTHYVTYDKMGKVYDFETEDALLYYTRDGDAYVYEWGDFLVSTDEEWIVKAKKYNDEQIYLCKEKHIARGAEDCFVDEDGYFVFDLSLHPYYGNDEYDFPLLYYDDDGNLFYLPEDCSWDKDGNLVFAGEQFRNFDKENIKHR